LVLAVALADHLVVVDLVADFQVVLAVVVFLAVALVVVGSVLRASSAKKFYFLPESFQLKLHFYAVF
jgi:hypothetical protein